MINFSVPVDLDEPEDLNQRLAAIVWGGLEKERLFFIELHGPEILRHGL